MFGHEPLELAGFENAGVDRTVCDQRRDAGILRAREEDFSEKGFRIVAALPNHALKDVPTAETFRRIGRHAASPEIVDPAKTRVVGADDDGRPYGFGGVRALRTRLHDDVAHLHLLGRKDVEAAVHKDEVEAGRFDALQKRIVSEHFRAEFECRKGLAQIRHGRSEGTREKDRLKRALYADGDDRFLRLFGFVGRMCAEGARPGGKTRQEHEEQSEKAPAERGVRMVEHGGILPKIPLRVHRFIQADVSSRGRIGLAAGRSSGSRPAASSICSRGRPRGIIRKVPEYRRLPELLRSNAPLPRALPGRQQSPFSFVRLFAAPHGQRHIFPCCKRTGCLATLLSLKMPCPQWSP